MRESEIERHLVWHVVRMGGVAYKFKSTNHRGVSDRVVCLPNGQTWFIELKAKNGRLAPLQKVFAQEMERLGQRYVCLWTKEQVDAWAATVSG
mgnify:FL=1|jgi:hypothetical protein